jgi:hypothetical protein
VIHHRFHLGRPKFGLNLGDLPAELGFVDDDLVLVIANQLDRSRAFLLLLLRKIVVARERRVALDHVVGHALKATKKKGPMRQRRRKQKE